MSSFGSQKEERRNRRLPHPRLVCSNHSKMPATMAGPGEQEMAKPKFESSGESGIK